MTFGKSFKTSVPQFPHLLMRIIMVTISEHYNEEIIYKMLKIMSGNRAIYIYVYIYIFSNHYYLISLLLIKTWHTREYRLVWT